MLSKHGDVALVRRPLRAAPQHAQIVFGIRSRGYLKRTKQYPQKIL
jgi:hypothetical protein